jgi:hypothetical protein
MLSLLRLHLAQLVLLNPPRQFGNLTSPQATRFLYCHATHNPQKMKRIGTSSGRAEAVEKINCFRLIRIHRNLNREVTGGYEHTLREDHITELPMGLRILRAINEMGLEENVFCKSFLLRRWSSPGGHLNSFLICFFFSSLS